MYIVPIDHGASSCKPPKCEAYQYAKQKRITPINPKHPDAFFKEGLLTAGNLWPSDCISCDQYMSTTLGQLAHTPGKEDKFGQLV